MRRWRRTNVAMNMLEETTGRRVLIVCGGGNNGGDGLAIARHLHNRGIEVAIALTTNPDTYKGDALINFNIIRAMKLSVIEVTPPVDVPDSTGGATSVALASSSRFVTRR